MAGAGESLVTARRHGSDMTISWLGVGLLGGGTRVAHGANFTGYRVTVGGASHDTQAQHLTIPYQAGIIRVQQMNKFTGAGPAVEIVV